MTPLIEQVPPGVESQILLCVDGTYDTADFIKDLINHCVDHRLKVTKAESPPDYFKWHDAKGAEITVNNMRLNKVILSFAPA
jgi:hypothetical protein